MRSNDGGLGSRAYAQRAGSMDPPTRPICTTLAATGEAVGTEDDEAAGCTAVVFWGLIAICGAVWLFGSSTTRAQLEQVAQVLLASFDDD